VTVAYLIRCVDAGERVVERTTAKLLHYDKVALRMALGFTRRLVQYQKQGVKRLCASEKLVHSLFKSLNNAQILDEKKEEARK